MKHKPIVPRALARNDVESALDYYLRKAGETVAGGFVTALEAAYHSIGRRPATGSPRYGYELDLPGLRSKRLRRYPYLVFYIELTDHIDVWRVLHMSRDIPPSLESMGDR